MGQLFQLYELVLASGFFIDVARTPDPLRVRIALQQTFYAVGGGFDGSWYRAKLFQDCPARLLAEFANQWKITGKFPLRNGERRCFDLGVHPEYLWRVAREGVFYTNELPHKPNRPYAARLVPVHDNQGGVTLL